MADKALVQFHPTRLSDYERVSVPQQSHRTTLTLLLVALGVWWLVFKK